MYIIFKEIKSIVFMGKDKDSIKYQRDKAQAHDSNVKAFIQKWKVFSNCFYVRNSRTWKIK